MPYKGTHVQTGPTVMQQHHLQRYARISTLLQGVRLSADDDFQYGSIHAYLKAASDSSTKRRR